jgi:hypothetical protein
MLCRILQHNFLEVRKKKTKFFSHLIYLGFEMFEKLGIVIDQVFKIAPVNIIKGEY